MSGLSQKKLADRLGVARTAVTNWERGTRMASIEIDRIDTGLDADGVLAGLLWAHGSPEALAPGRIWTNVYPGESTPVWMWLRSPSPTLTIEAEWGQYRIEAELELGVNGVLVTLGASVADSPVLVHLSEPGWVDFGRGAAPPDMAGLPTLDAYEAMRPGTDRGGFQDLLSKSIAEHLDQPRPLHARSLSPKALQSVRTFLEEVDRLEHREGAKTWPPVSEGIESVDRSRFTLMRHARRLSLLDTVQRLAGLTDTIVSKDTLRRFESDDGQPHDPLLPAALDHVLGGNGHLAMTKVGSGHGPGEVYFPRYWLAPVWLSFDRNGGGGANGNAESVVELHWGGWRRRIVGDMPMLIINHASMIPLRIIADASVGWTAGVGRITGAVPINQGWLPDSVDTTREALSTYEAALMDAARYNTVHNAGKAVRPDSEPKAG